MASKGPTTRTRAVHAASPRTNKLCSLDDDVKLLIVSKLHSIDDYNNLMAVSSAWRDLLDRHRILIMKGIVVSMT
jgi:hypothetical protein